MPIEMMLILGYPLFVTLCSFKRAAVFVWNRELFCMLCGPLLFLFHHSLLFERYPNFCCYGVEIVSQALGSGLLISVFDWIRSFLVYLSSNRPCTRAEACLHLTLPQRLPTIMHRRFIAHTVTCGMQYVDWSPWGEWRWRCLVRAGTDLFLLSTLSH